jgi:hypothetical protein
MPTYGVDMVLRDDNMNNQTHVVQSNSGCDHAELYMGNNFVTLW